jgi:hypothetical protein
VLLITLIFLTEEASEDDERITEILEAKLHHNNCAGIQYIYNVLDQQLYCPSVNALIFFQKEKLSTDPIVTIHTLPCYNFCYHRTISSWSVVSGVGEPWSP